MALSNKQIAFIDAYIKSWNATQAAIEAGYSEKTARSIGSENLTKPDISEEIKRRIDELAVSSDEVLVRLGEHARGDIGDFLDVNGNVTLTGKKTRLIKKITVRRVVRAEIEEINTTLELYDAQAALQLLGKHHDLFIDKLQVRIEKELDKALDLLETQLDGDTYRRVLTVLSSTKAIAEDTGSGEATE